MTRLAKLEVALVPKSTYALLGGWQNLNTDEQNTVVRETEEMAEAVVREGFSKLEIGKHLSEVRKVLEPHGIFVDYLKEIPQINWRTAYRYMSTWENVQESLPEHALKFLLARGVNIVGYSKDEPLGAYTEPLAKLPPPKSQSSEVLNKWVDDLMDMTAKQKHKRKKLAMNGEDESDPEILLKESVRFSVRNFRKLPRNHKSRTAWMQKLVGMLLNELGVANPMSFSPIAVPEDFRTGRPKNAA